MSATFDPALGTARDFVRLLIGDTDVANAQLADETIDAILVRVIANGASAAGAPYCAAAQAGANLLARWTTSGAGAIVEKTVSKLSIKYAAGGSASQAYNDYLDHLRRQCTSLSLSGPVVLKAW